MEKMNAEVFNRIDENNMKAMSILRSVIKIIDDENEEINIAGIDLAILLDTAADLIAKNDSIFNQYK